jgi:hypothetical protein
MQPNCCLNPGAYKGIFCSSCGCLLQVRMVVDDNEKGFGFTRKNEIINGRAAMIGFFMIVVQELVSGKGFLKGIGFLDFLYKFVFNGYSP